MNCILLLLLCSFPIYLVCWPFTNCFSKPSAQEKIDFSCPHHCGEWGSESIRNLEWQFIQCLYKADQFQNFIESNEERSGEWIRVLIKYKRHETPIHPPFLEPPQDFRSEWYQKMLITNRNGRLVISNNYGCYDGWEIFWKIKHVDQPDGTNVGKIFRRTKYTYCDPYNDIIPEDHLRGEDKEEVDEEHKNDPSRSLCLCSNLIEKNTYRFSNRIDFQNACLQLEQDLFEEVQDSSFRDTDINPLFKQEMDRQFAHISKQLQEARDSYNAIFKECQRTHHAPSADYELIMQHFEKGDYIEAVDQLKDLLGKVKMDGLEAHLASTHLYL